MKADWSIDPVDLIPMSSVMQQTTDTALQRVLSKQEQEIREVLDVHLLAGWTLDDVKRRCRLERVMTSSVQTLYLDDMPILEIHPIEFGEVERREGSYVQTITQKFRRL